MTFLPYPPHLHHTVPDDIGLQKPALRAMPGAHRVGGRVASPVRPHHRTYGSVYGGSSAPLQGPELSKKVEETPLRE